MCLLNLKEMWIKINYLKLFKVTKSISGEEELVLKIKQNYPQVGSLSYIKF